MPTINNPGVAIVIVDYGVGNLASAQRALEECGAKVRISDDPRDLAGADRIVVPGVGAFAHAMRKLRSGGWVEPLRAAVLDDGIPVLGICLGMQLLAASGEEGGGEVGLGLIPGSVRRLVPAAHERIPHVGWNAVEPRFAAPLFAGIPSGTDFYFVHSYEFVPDDATDIAATAPYCGSIVAAVARGHISGVQFHPEKSSRAGFQLLRNFLALQC